MDRDLEIADTRQRILNTFKYYKQGPSVPSDGNCGLHAICKALVDGLYMAESSIKPNSLMLKICYMFGLENLPNYWWSDEELAVIANDYGYDMYIYNETDRTGIVFGKGIRPPLVLYSVNNNSHWIPGMRTVVPSSRIPENFTIVENITEVLSIRQIKIKIKRHLMQSLNPSRGCIESYSGKRDESGSSSNGRRNSSSSRHNGSRRGGHGEGRDVSHHGRNNVSRNKKRDESRSGGRNGVRIIVRQDGRRPQLEKGHGREVKESHSAWEKESRNGGQIRRHSVGENKSHNGGKIGSHSGGEKESNSGEEKSISQKSDEKLLVQYSSTVNGDCSYGMDAIKQEFSLYSKLKNTVLSKMIRQLYHLNWNKKNKYKKLDLFDTEDEGDDSEDKELNTMYNTRYKIMRDVLHHFVSKKERKLLVLEACDALVALQSLEATMIQLEPFKCSELGPVEVKCHLEDGNCCQIAAVEYSPIATVDCCSNSAFECPYKISDCPFTSTNCPCNIDDCPFTSPEYPLSDHWVSDKYVKDLVDGYTLERKKIKGTRLFDHVYNQAVAMSHDIIVRCIVKRKRVVDAPPAVASVLVAPAVAASMVAASVVASPAMAAWMVAAPGLSSSVMQVAQAVVAPAMVNLMMVVPEVAASTIAVEVAPLDNDLVTVPVDNELLAISMKDNLTMTLVGNDSVVKPNACVKRYFSPKQIWKKQTKTQHSKDH